MEWRAWLSVVHISQGQLNALSVTKRRHLMCSDTLHTESDMCSGTKRNTLWKSYSATCTWNLWQRTVAHVLLIKYFLLKNRLNNAGKRLVPYTCVCQEILLFHTPHIRSNLCASYTPCERVNGDISGGLADAVNDALDTLQATSNAGVSKLTNDIQLGVCSRKWECENDLSMVCSFFYRTESGHVCMMNRMCHKQERQCA
jgi:hypothetical protein